MTKTTTEKALIERGAYLDTLEEYELSNALASLTYLVSLYHDENTGEPFATWWEREKATANIGAGALTGVSEWFYDIERAFDNVETRDTILLDKFIQETLDNVTA